MTCLFVFVGQCGNQIGGRVDGLHVDTEESVVARFRPHGLPHQFITCVSGSGNNWAVGYAYGESLKNKLEHSIQQELDRKKITTICIVHSLGGGTGSGLGSFISGMFDTICPKIPKTSVCVMPSDVITGPYNAVLALNHLIADYVVPIDNNCFPSDDYAASLIHTVSGLDLSFLLPMRELRYICATHSVPFCKPKHWFLRLKSPETVFAVMATQKVETNYVWWNPNACKIFEHQTPRMLSNTTGIVQPLQELKTSFSKLMKKRAGMHHYLEIIERNEFLDGLESLNQTIEQYADQKPLQIKDWESWARSL